MQHNVCSRLCQLGCAGGESRGEPRRRSRGHLPAEEDQAWPSSLLFLPEAAGHASCECHHRRSASSRCEKATVEIHLKEASSFSDSPCSLLYTISKSQFKNYQSTNALIVCLPVLRPDYVFKH